MTSYHILGLDDDGFVQSGRIGRKRPVVDPKTIVVPEALWLQVTDDILVVGTNAYRWQWVNGAMEEAPDNRPEGTWSVTRLILTRGDPEPVVQLTLNSRFGGTLTLRMPGVKDMDVDFVSGVANVTISTDESTRGYVIAESKDLIFSNELFVSVASNVPGGATAGVLRPE